MTDLRTEQLLAERRVEVLARAKILADAFWQNGSMVVVYPGLVTRTFCKSDIRADRFPTVSEVESKALSLAEASVPLSRELRHRLENTR